MPPLHLPVVLGTLAAMCGSPMPPPDASVDPKDDGSSSPGCAGYESLAATVTRWTGSYTLDSATNSTCPNPVGLTIGAGAGTLTNIPSDLDPHPGCPDAQFFGIFLASAKACSGDVSCTNDTSGFGFYVHRYKPGTSFPPKEQLLRNAAGVWSKTASESVNIDPMNADALFFDGARWTRSPPPSGGCKM